MMGTEAVEVRHLALIPIVGTIRPSRTERMSVADGPLAHHGRTTCSLRTDGATITDGPLARCGRMARPSRTD